MPNPPSPPEPSTAEPSSPGPSVSAVPWPGAERFLLTSPEGQTCEVTNFGARLLSFRGRDGHNVVLSYETLDEYLTDPAYLGAVVGRVANRIFNARFSFQGRECLLPANDGPHHHHGGPGGFSFRFFESDLSKPGAVVFRLHSPDGDGGYPGALDVCVTYEFQEGALSVTMEATSPQTTVLNLAHHPYFNLEHCEQDSNLEGCGVNSHLEDCEQDSNLEGGKDIPTVLEHRLTLACASCTPGAPKVPDGAVKDVSGTALDFLTPRLIGERLPPPDSTGEPAGYDHNFFAPEGESYTAERSAEHPCRKIATLEAPRSGRKLLLFSNQPCVQVYSANYFDGTRRGTRGPLQRHAGLCLETQAPPNAINVPAWRPMVILPAGKSYRHQVLYRLF